MSLTDALRAGAPQAFGALYDEYAGALYAYCHVMVGDEAGDALRDAFITVARHPGAVPGDDAELPVWLHSLARDECVRRGALMRGLVTSSSAGPPRRALALLRPEHREVLALSNALDPAETAQVLGVTRDTAETLVREAQRRLEQAAASVSGRETQDSAMLAALNGEALRRLVTLGYEPPAGQREWVLSSFAPLERAPEGAAVSDADRTPRPMDAFSALADDATQQFPMISPDESATAPMRRIDGISPSTRPDQSRPGESMFLDPAPAGLGAVGRESVGAGAAEGSNAYTSEQPRLVRGTHAKQRKPFLSRRVLPVVGLVACVAAATGAALAWPGPHHTKATSALVHQSVKPSRSAQPTPAGDQATPSPRPATSDAGKSPTPTDTAAAPTVAAPPSSTAPADGSSSPAPTQSTEPTPSAEPTPSFTPRRPPTPRPKPDHTATRGSGHGTIGRRGPGRACHGAPGRASRCARPHPRRPPVVRPRR